MKKYFVVLLIFASMFFVSSPALAFPTLIPVECTGNAQVHDNPNTPDVVECTVCEPNQTERANCCCDLSSFQAMAFNVAQIILGISGSVALALFVYGGVLYITSRGESSKIQKATSVITSAVIGLAIILLAGVIVKFALRKITGIE